MSKRTGTSQCTQCQQHFNPPKPHLRQQVFQSFWLKCNLCEQALEVDKPAQIYQHCWYHEECLQFMLENESEDELLPVSDLVLSRT